MWQFGAGKDRVSRGGTLALPVDKPLPTGWARKSWISLVSPRLNIALLPPGSVFLRVLQLPAGDPSELGGLVEFQLERLSPLPVNQVVWTAESIVNPNGREQTAIVVIVERSVVEEFLGKLEGAGFVADRLEVPLLRELFAATSPTTGLQLFLRDEVDHQLCLSAWWSEGILRDISIARLVAGAGAPEALVGLLTQTAWAAEVEGWLAAPPPVQIFATADLAQRFRPALEDWSGQSLTQVQPTPVNQVAELTAIAALGPPAGGLVPEETQARTRQQFVDGIWMRGLGILGLTYAMVVVVYLGMLYFKTGKLDDAKSSAIVLGKQYTNTIQLREQMGILEDQVTLKFAALECWRTAAELLPLSLNLTSFTFDKGNSLTFVGYGPAGAAKEVGDFETALRNAKSGDQPLFAAVKTESIEAKGVNSNWRITAQLKRTERQ